MCRQDLAGEGDVTTEVKHLLLHLVGVLGHQHRALAALRDETARRKERVLLPLRHSGVTWRQTVVVAESRELGLHQVSDGTRHDLYDLVKERAGVEITPKFLAGSRTN